MTDVAVISLADPRWLAFAADCAEATPFHHPAWSEVLTRTYGMRSFALGISDEAGAIRAAAPFIEVRGLSLRRRWISLPFTDECAPLARDGDARAELLDALAGVHDRLRAPRIEVRGAVDAVGWTKTAAAVTHHLALERDPDRVCRRFSRSQVLRNVARAEREGTTVRVAESSEDLDAFYGLHVRTRRRQGVPVQPRRFFDAIWSALVMPGLGTILLADADGQRAVAGALFLTWNGTTIYKFGASDPTALRLRPNHLIFNAAIRAACERGDQRFDFGRTDLDNKGLRAFKSGWGAEERPLAYSSLAPGAAESGGGLVTRVLASVIRRGPVWLGRGIGEAFYRFAA